MPFARNHQSLPKPIQNITSAPAAVIDLQTSAAATRHSSRMSLPLVGCQSAKPIMSPIRDLAVQQSELARRAVHPCAGTEGNEGEASMESSGGTRLSDRE
jgi:hypothetical protein